VDLQIDNIKRIHLESINYFRVSMKKNQVLVLQAVINKQIALDKKRFLQGLRVTMYHSNDLLLKDKNIKF